jgi:hypothetical protein
MSTNISVITDTTEEAVSSVVSAVNGLTLAHINGDFGAHNQMRVYAQNFVEPVSGAIISDHTLRIQMYNPDTGQTVVLAMPCFVTAGTVSGGPPIILTEPLAAIDADIGTPAQFAVQAASQTVPGYQWQKLISSGFSSIAGATSSILVFPDVQATDAGAYQVVVSNAFGTAVSTTGSLTATPVVTPATQTIPVSPFTTPLTGQSITLATGAEYVGSAGDIQNLYTSNDPAFLQGTFQVLAFTATTLTLYCIRTTNGGVHWASPDGIFVLQTQG